MSVLTEVAMLAPKVPQVNYLVNRNRCPVLGSTMPAREQSSGRSAPAAALLNNAKPQVSLLVPAPQLHDVSATAACAVPIIVQWVGLALPGLGTAGITIHRLP